MNDNEKRCAVTAKVQPQLFFKPTFKKDSKLAQVLCTSC